MAIIDPIVEQYAKSLYTLASVEKCVERVDREISTMKKLLSENLDLMDFLKSDNINPEGKKKALLELFAKKLSPITLYYINLLADLNRMNLLEQIIDAFSELIGVETKVITVSVTTAIPMNEDMKRVLEAKLKKMLGGDVYIKKSVDNSIVGGLEIRVGDKYFDGTIRTQLEKIKTNVVRNII